MVRRWRPDIPEPAVCPPALLSSLPALETMWWHKVTPSPLHLQAMQALPTLQRLELVDAEFNRQQPCCLPGLAGLTGLTLLDAKFWSGSSIAPVAQLTLLEILRVDGGLASGALLRRILAVFPRLKDVRWCTFYSSDDPGGPLSPLRPGAAAGSLTRLACSPVDCHACDLLSALAFPVLQTLRATADMAILGHPHVNDSLAWFPHMCRSALRLTSLELAPPPSSNEHRVSHVQDGVSLLTALASLHVVLADASDDFVQAPRRFVGAQPLAGLTRLTRLWAEGVVDPRFFDREVAALAGLKALRELLLVEPRFALAGEHRPRPQDGAITREALDRLRAALPSLRRFAVMGGWLDLGRPGWAGSWVTPEGLIVRQSPPLTAQGMQKEGGEGSLEGLQDAPNPWCTSQEEGPFLALEVLLAV